jgi:hypothetical protein
MPRDPAELALRRHREWLGYLQPVGLVVSPAALCAAEAFVDEHAAAEHQKFLAHVTDGLAVGREPAPAVLDLPALLCEVFGWQAGDLVPADDPRARDLTVALTEYHDTLRPTFAVPAPGAADGSPAWLLLIETLPVGTPLDEARPGGERAWQATPQARFERLLRETQVPIGLLANGTHLRLVYAPRGESAGHVTFPVEHMTGVAGRPIFAALHMLLSDYRVFNAPDGRGLADILRESRKYQNTVSTELARQVLAALFELLRGFQAADDAARGALLRDVLARDPDEVYAGLLTVLLRLVFLLYAEDRGLMSDDEVYTRFYSVTGLFERLREDAGRYPDTMDQRYGAWAQLLALFRIVHDGARHGRLRLPARRGYLFNPDRYPFLEGRPPGSLRQPGERIWPPLVADAVVFRVLQNLLVLGGERISYRSLDVEQIGSVYETVMGFRLEKAAGRSIAVKPKKAHGAPVTVDLDALLAESAGGRGKWLKERADQELTGRALAALKEAATPEAVVAALDRKVARELTPNVVPPGAMVLQPSDERRRSGSHYTPRALTEPIVRKALAPVLRRLGERPTPEQILGLRVCDPAMGSGAFLVEACRQLGEALLAAWAAAGSLPRVPADETPELFAQRAVAQRCLYGVDKNSLAADLAKLSLWLATLARDHPFTFLDHALRHGDSLVGLSMEQIRRFHWKPGHKQMLTGQEKLRERIEAATRARRAILEAGDEAPDLDKRQKLDLADESLELVRLAGNLVVAAFFAGANDRQRQGRRDELLANLNEYLRTGSLALRPTKAEAALREGPTPLYPFHWEAEFPEVFAGPEPGFDCFVGNPPFMGGKRISTNYGEAFRDWLSSVHTDSSKNADLVAHFFRRAFDLLKVGGTFGLIATNTIAQGDTRAAGLGWIRAHNGIIYAARRRYKWPGQAAVVVSVVHIAKEIVLFPFELDGRQVQRITAYLFDTGPDDPPTRLIANASRCFIGNYLHGMGFTFDDHPLKPTASPLSVMDDIIRQHPPSASIIKPLIGGEEINNSPKVEADRFVIDFAGMSYQAASQYPPLLRLVRERVKPERDRVSNKRVREKWWQFEYWAPELRDLLPSLKRVFAVNCGATPHLGIAAVPTNVVCSHTVAVFPFDRYTAFSVLQSRLHEVWCRREASSMKDDLRYTPTDCLETFPFSDGFEADPKLESAGRAYYEFRAELMVRNNEGLTKTYNRFHDPDEPSADVARLRELHAAMDRAVLDAYGWSDLRPACGFYLDYEDEDDADEEPAGRRARRKPYRYRWPDEFRDEVLARLLELNRRRAEAERQAGAAPAPKKPGHKKSGKKGPEGRLF